MENLLTLLITLAALILVVKILAAPIRLLWKILLHSAFGFLCLWILNLVSGFTGVVFPLNILTCAVAGFLGVPGILILLIVELFL